MSDFKNINQFRKTTQLRKINEDPTYLSFFLLFNFGDRENSPLLAGAASDYLRIVVGDDERADMLDRFVGLLRKINQELPWFWQTLSGLEVSRQFGKMEEPWRGAEKPKVEIECLENIELTGAALIDLYKRACYDFVRWVEVVPKNLRYFEMMVFVTEIRTFQQKATDALKDSRGNYGLYGDSQSTIQNDVAVNSELSIDAQPIFVTKLGFCEFDIDSTNELWADLSKNPEMAKDKISIFWNTAEQMDQLYGYNLNANQENSLVLEKAPSNIQPNNPFDPGADTRKVGVDSPSGNVFPPGKKQNPLSKDGSTGGGTLSNLGAAAKQKLGSIADDARDAAAGAVAGVTNIAGGLPGNNGLGNAHGSLLTGQLGQLANSAVEGALARLLLGNVHGLNAASTIQDAINSGSLNGILNAAGQIFGAVTNAISVGGKINISPNNIYPNIAVDSSPDGNLNQRVHDPVVDSSPDGNLNQNVYE